jgi:hypothetical protein
MFALYGFALVRWGPSALCGVAHILKWGIKIDP